MKKNWKEKLEAEAHLEERKDESYSALSSLKLSKSSADSYIAEIRAKMASAEIKAKQKWKKND